MDSLLSLLGKVRAYSKTPPRHTNSWVTSFEKCAFYWAIELKNPLFVCLCMCVSLLGFKQPLKFKWGVQVETWVFLERGGKGREREAGIFWGRLSLWVEVTSTTPMTGSCRRASLNLSPLVKSRVLTSQSRSYKPPFSTPREGSADLQRKVDCSVAMETGLVLNPIIKQRLSNNRSRPTCTKDILGCGLIPELWRTDCGLCKVIWWRTKGCLY